MCSKNLGLLLTLGKIVEFAAGYRFTAKLSTDGVIKAFNEPLSLPAPTDDRLTLTLTDTEGGGSEQVQIDDSTAAQVRYGLDAELEALVFTMEDAQHKRSRVLTLQVLPEKALVENA